MGNRGFCLGCKAKFEPAVGAVATGQKLVYTRISYFRHSSEPYLLRAQGLLPHYVWLFGVRNGTPASTQPYVTLNPYKLLFYECQVDGCLILLDNPSHHAIFTDFLCLNWKTPERLASLVLSVWHKHPYKWNCLRKTGTNGFPALTTLTARGLQGSSEPCHCAV